MVVLRKGVVLYKKGKETKRKNDYELQEKKKLTSKHSVV